MSVESAPLYKKSVNENSQFGILRMEDRSNNTKLDVSTVFEDNMNVYTPLYLLDGNADTAYASKSEENSYIIASLKDGKVFTIDNYMLKGNAASNEWQNTKWRIDGQLLSGDWIILDERYNDPPLTTSELRTYSISYKGQLKAVRFTNCGMRPHGDFCIYISAFEIFGSVYQNVAVSEIEQLKEKVKLLEKENKDQNEIIQHLEKSINEINLKLAGFG